MNFALIDPRPIPEAEGKNSKVLGPNALGIEVTIPALASRCGMGNIDPQHTGGDPNTAAIEAALTFPIPTTDDLTLVTIRPDLDSIGAMAVIYLRSNGVSLTQSMLDRVSMIADADKFARGPWPGRRPLPTRTSPWSSEAERRLAAIAAAVSDANVPIRDRVLTMASWLAAGDEPTEYRTKADKDRLDLIEALENKNVWCKLFASGYIVLVESTHRAATTIGYYLAPVVVALNPLFRQGDLPPYRKFTVCQYNTWYINLRAVCEELSQMEPGWGGSPTIIGSPQGVSSKLATDVVIAVVKRYLFK